MNDLMPLENPNVPALFSPGGLAEILNKIESDALALVPDLSTAKTAIIARLEAIAELTPGQATAIFNAIAAGEIPGLTTSY